MQGPGGLFLLHLGQDPERWPRQELRPGPPHRHGPHCLPRCLGLFKQRRCSGWKESGAGMMFLLLGHPSALGAGLPAADRMMHPVPSLNQAFSGPGKPPCQ